MKIRNLTYLIVALLATGLLWGCGSSGSGGSDFVDLQPDPDSVATLGVSNCATCHLNTPIMNKWLESKHASGISGYYEDRCSACHNPLDDGQLMTQAFGITDIDKVVGCESCHGGGSAHRGIGSFPYPVPDADQCIQCHSTLSAYHLRENPFSDEITERFNDGRHTGRARTGNCAACHSHEGGVLLLSQSSKIDTIGQIGALSDKLAGLGSDLNSKTCATCHDPHSGELRGLGDVTEAIGDVATSTGPAERVIYSAQYNLCTSCHQVNLDHEFVEDIGYNNGGMFEYSLSAAYLHANDPYGDPSNVGYHSNSYQDRSFFETHFNGQISKDLYYYDIKDGVEKASSDRFGNPIPEVVNDPAAMEFLAVYYQEYLSAPDNIEVKGYGVNPGSPYACSSCHDVHSANRIVGTEDLIKQAGHVLNAEPSIQTAIAFGDGIGMSHNNYISDAFSRERIGCTPCHTGNEFVNLTVDGTPDSSARWNSIGCISCHDMVDTEGVVLTEARTFPDSYEFAFTSGDVVTADLGADQVCFECHKGRNAYKADATTVYGTNYLHYSPSFATLLGPEGMYPSYGDNDYTRDWDGHYHTVGGYPTTCTGCHNIHEEYAPFSSRSGQVFGRDEFDSVLTTNLCGSCHYVTDPDEANFQRSFNVLKGRTQVFADTLFATIISELSKVVTTSNDAAIIIQGVNGANVTLTAAQVTSFTNVFGASYATATTDVAIEKRLKTYITGSTRDVTGSRLVNNTLAKAGAVWKNFVYDDKGGWAHNSILARQLMFDAIVSLDATKLNDLKAQANAMYLGLGLTQQQIDANDLLGNAGNGSLMRYLSVTGGTQRTLP